MLIILVGVILLTGLITPFSNALGGVVPPQIDEMAKEMASSPITGQYSDTLDSYGILRVSWGLSIGAYMFIVAPITKPAAGIFVRKAVGTEKQETEKEQKS